MSEIKTLKNHITKDLIWNIHFHSRLRSLKLLFHKHSKNVNFLKKRKKSYCEYIDVLISSTNNIMYIITLYWDETAYLYSNAMGKFTTKLQYSFISCMGIIM